jgi:integrase
MPRKARSILTACLIRRIKKAGKYAEGEIGGLYLIWRNPKARFWILRVGLKGKRLELGLGPYPEITLERAREKARALRELVALGKDPREEKLKAEEARRAEEAAREEERKKRSKRMTFADVAGACWKSKAAEFKSAKHAEQWRNTLATYALPELGEKFPEEITTEDVLKVLSPIWTVKTETATRVRQRIETVIGYSFALNQMHDRMNPARLKNNLDRLLPSAAKLIRKKKKHHPAVPWERMPVFMAALRTRGWRITKQTPYGGLGPRMLEFAILTTSRDAEVRGAKWSEIDFAAKKWTVPADRMKGELTHEVPLSEEAVKLLKALPRMDACEYVFFGSRLADGTYGPLSNAAMGKAIDDLHEADVLAGGIGFLDPKVNKIATPHGTARSSFKDWARNCTTFQDEVSELCLAHVSTDATRAAYARDQLMGPRRLQLEQWTSYLQGPAPGGKVISLPSKRSADARAAA